MVTQTEGNGQDREQNTPLVLPLTGCLTLTITDRKLLPNGNGEARIEIRDAHDTLQRAVLLQVSPRRPFVLIGDDRLNVLPDVERAICRLIFDPDLYDEVLAWATDGGTPVPALPPLPEATAALLRSLEYVHRAGLREGYERGLREGMIERDDHNRAAPTITRPHTPSSRLCGGRAVQRD